MESHRSFVADPVRVVMCAAYEPITTPPLCHHMSQLMMLEGHQKDAPSFAELTPNGVRDSCSWFALARSPEELHYILSWQLALSYQCCAMKRKCKPKTSKVTAFLKSWFDALCPFNALWGHERNVRGFLLSVGGTDPSRIAYVMLR
eukprot:193395-Amphidinium_carterae.1